MPDVPFAFSVVALEAAERLAAYHRDLVRNRKRYVADLNKAEVSR